MLPDRHLIAGEVNEVRPGTTCSVVVLSYNEEARIRECLESAAWCDEIVVVDGFSTDNTVAIAREYTDKVFLSDRLGPRNPGGFAAQRNFALDQVTSEWVFFLDADERFTPELSSEIRRIQRGGVPGNIAAFRIRRREHFFGVYTPYTHGEAWQTRMVRGGRARWDGRLVHEGLNVEGDTGSLSGYLLHYSKDSINDYVATQSRYTSLEAEQAVRDRVPLESSPLLGMLRTFLNIYVYKGACREGAFGLIMALLFTHYNFLCWAKRWEIEMKAGRVAPGQPNVLWLEWIAGMLGRGWRAISPPLKM